MRKTKGMALSVICLGLLAAGAASAATVGLSGGRHVRLVDRPGTQRDRLEVEIVDPAIASPLGDPRCPSTSALRIQTDAQTLTANLDCSRWRQLGTDRYVYRDRDGTAGGVRRIVLVGDQARTGRRWGRLRVRLDGDNYGATSLVGPVSFVEVELSIDSDGYCSNFAEPTSTLQRNDADIVHIKGPASTDCSAEVDPNDCCALRADGQDSAADACVLAECEDECRETLADFRADCDFCDGSNPDNCETERCLGSIGECIPIEDCLAVYEQFFQLQCAGADNQRSCTNAKNDACTL